MRIRSIAGLINSTCADRELLEAKMTGSTPAGMVSIGGMNITDVRSYQHRAGTRAIINQ